MSANPNWARWVFASVATYLKQVAAESHLPALVEGLDDRTTEFMEATDRCEIRITGPFTKELSHNYFQVEVLVNVRRSPATLIASAWFTAAVVEPGGYRVRLCDLAVLVLQHV